MTRTTSDGTRNYQRAGAGASASTTMVQDEKGNQTLYHFSIDWLGNYEQTHQQVYQGTDTSGTLLQEVTTCYNGASGNCDGQAINNTITEADTTTSYNGGSQVILKNSYDTYGDLLNSATYSGSTLLLQTATSYTTNSQVLSTQTTDGSGNVLSSASYEYDKYTNPNPPLTTTSGLPQHVSVSGARGNQTAAHIGVNSSTTLTTTTAYYDTGMPVSTTSPNGMTGYSYDATGTFATQTTLPTPSSGVALSTSATYDTASGALLSSTGVNSGQTTTVNVYDGLPRPRTQTLPSGGQVALSYNNLNNPYVAWNINLSTGQNGGFSTLLDGYGRTVRQALNNGQSSNPWYQTDYCYDATGLLHFVATSYQGPGFGASIRCSGSGTTTTYDALGRITSVATPDGTSTTQYQNRAVLATDVNGAKRITQYDLLGRVTGVCEISSNNLNGQAPASCGMDIAGTGYLTSYGYVYNQGQTVTVTQGAQTRTFQTDEAGRTIAVSEPERGATTYAYSYNGTGLQIVRTRPKANQSNAGVTTATTTQYDSLSRIASVGYNDGLTPGKNFYYDVLPSGLGWSQSLSNIKGRLVATNSGSGSTRTSSAMNYDITGNVTNLWACGPSICGGSGQAGRSLSFAYNLSGALTSESDAASGTINYGRSSAGEITSVTNATYTDAADTPNLVSNVQNSPFGPAVYSLGNGLNAIRSYDSSGRNNGNWLCSGSSVAGCGGSGGIQLYASNNTYSGVRLTSTCDTVLNQCQTNGYDEFNRLTSITDNPHNAGDAGSYTYTYDRYGNRLTQTAQYGGPSPSYTFNPANNRITTLSYDAAGNVLNDGVAHSYTYDAEGNVLSVDGGNTAQYVYDAGNHRVRVQTSSQTTEYLFDAAGRRISSWLLGSGYPANGFGGEGRIYMDGTQIAYRGLTGQTYFVHKNWLGTERMRTNYQGKLAASEFSLPFGDGFNQGVSIAGSDQDNDQFAGQDYDSESGTQHAQFRQYSSTQGRWMGPDPYDGSYDASNPQSLNRYSYALNNPLVDVDPSGLSCQQGTDGTVGDDGDGLGCAGNVSNDGTGVDGWDLNPGSGTDVGAGGSDSTGGPSGDVDGRPLIDLGGRLRGGGSVQAPSSGIVGRLIHKAVCSFTSPLWGAAEDNGKVFGVGAGASGGFGFIVGIAASVGVQVVADPQKNVAVSFSGLYNPGGYGVFGVGAIAGAQGSISTANSVGSGVTGATDVGGSGGSGPAVGVDVTRGSDGSYTGSVTVGAGWGGRGGALSGGGSYVPAGLITNCKGS